MSYGFNQVNDMTDNATIEKKDKYYNNVRLSLMITIAGTEKSVDEDEAPLESIRKMNLMIKSIICLGPWKDGSKKPKLLKEFSEDVDIVERYVFDFNTFISPGGRQYCCIRLYFTDTTSIPEISFVIFG